jgi:octaprenyl-diphosphate synthase
MLNIVSKKSKTSHDITEVKRFIEAKGGFEYAEKVMEQYHQKALGQLTSYPDSEYKQALIAFVEYVTTRES